jgi:hypothetical protein
MGDDPHPPKERLKLAAAVAEQLDADLMDSAERYAGKRCAMLEKAGLWADAAELVQDAIEATLSGTRAWAPERYSLYHHVCGVIGSRTTSMLKHARKFHHERLGVRGERGDQTDPVETAASLRQEQDDAETQLLNAERVHRTVLQLRALAEQKNDRQVLGIIDAYGQGITERAEVAAHLGIGVRKYDHARMRMLRLASKLEEGADDA